MEQKNYEESQTVQNRIIENDVGTILKGKQSVGKEIAPIALIDSAVAVWIGARDENQILRIRPYETLEPQDGVIVSTTPVTVFTATAMKARLHIDVVNNQAASQATVRLRRNYDGSSTETNLCTPDTPIPVGIGFRIGTFDLNPSGYIEAECDTTNGAVVYVTVDAYDPVGP